MIKTGLIQKIYAQADQIVGSIDPGTSFKPYGGLSGFGLLFSNILRLVFVGAGIFALINFLVAGFQYMSSGGDAKALTAAWNRIWLSLVGLIIIVGSFALASLFGYLIFGDAGFILSPKLYGPAVCNGPYC